MISGTIDDAASDLIAGSAGTIGSVGFWLNGEWFSNIATNVTKSTNANSILKPYDFSGAFSTTLTGVELQPGVNLFHLSAKNSYGLSGFAEKSVEVLVTPPADQTYEYEVRVDDDPYYDSDPGVTIELRTRTSGGSWGSWRTLVRNDFDSFSGLGRSSTSCWTGRWTVRPRRTRSGQHSLIPAPTIRAK